MQRSLHSIFTARILLNLRQAAGQDRARMLTISSTGTTHESNQSRERGRTQALTRTALSSVIIGVDMWFPNSWTASRLQETSIWNSVAQLGVCLCRKWRRRPIAVYLGCWHVWCSCSGSVTNLITNRVGKQRHRRAFLNVINLVGLPKSGTYVKQDCRYQFIVTKCPSRW